MVSWQADPDHRLVAQRGGWEWLERGLPSSLESWWW